MTLSIALALTFAISPEPISKPFPSQFSIVSPFPISLSALLLPPYSLVSLIPMSQAALILSSSLFSTYPLTLILILIFYSYVLFIVKTSVNAHRDRFCASYLVACPFLTSDLLFAVMICSIVLMSVSYDHLMVKFYSSCSL